MGLVIRTGRGSGCIKFSTQAVLDITGFEPDSVEDGNPFIPACRPIAAVSVNVKAGNSTPPPTAATTALSVVVLRSLCALLAGTVISLQLRPCRGTAGVAGLRWSLAGRISS
jgi:hypothetical protein